MTALALERLRNFGEARHGSPNLQVIVANLFILRGNKFVTSSDLLHLILVEANKIAATTDNFFEAGT